MEDQKQNPIHHEKTVEELNWIYNLKQEASTFLDKLKGTQMPGFFHYSLSGDLFSEKEHWGLGNTVFAAKIYYTLGLIETLPQQQRSEMSNFIKNFQISNGHITDPLVKRKAFVREKLSAIRHNDYRNFFHQLTTRAETRQSVSALELLGETLATFPQDTPRTKEEIDIYLSKQDWGKPWGSGSHFSHLLFFLARSGLHNRTELVNHTIKWINRIQDPRTGSWFTGNPPLDQKINGAMKILTGLKAADRMEFNHAKELVDLALLATNDRHACDNFNVIFVLKYASAAMEEEYRKEEIQQFALDRIGFYKEYYWPEHGGFSFLKGKANHYYYKAIITKGLPEPDIHGTTLFLWGIALIAELLDINQELGFHEFTP